MVNDVVIERLFAQDRRCQRLVMFKLDGKPLGVNMRLDDCRLQFSDRNPLPGRLFEKVFPADHFVAELSGQVFGEFDTETLAAAGDTDYVHPSLVQLYATGVGERTFLR